jgi:hypothetical protein
MRVNARVAILAFAALLVLANPSAGLLFMLPAALLVALFALGRYPGERGAIARYRAARRAVRRIAPRRLGSPGRAPHSITPAGSAVLAFKRAVRPPPALLAAV